MKQQDRSKQPDIHILIQSVPTIIEKNQRTDAQKVFDILTESKNEIAQSTSLGRNIRSKITQLGKFLSGDALDIPRRKNVNKVEFLTRFSDRFIYAGHQDALGEHLRKVIIGNSGDWIMAICAVLSQYNNVRKPVLKMPTNGTSLALSLLGTRERISRVIFLEICFPNMPKTLLQKRKRESKKWANRDETINILYRNPDYINRIRAVIPSIPGKLWIHEVAKIFTEINTSIRDEERKLRKSPIGIARTFTGKRTIDKAQFCSILAIDPEIINPSIKQY